MIQIKNQSPMDAMADRVYSAVLTGNIEQARTLLIEFKALYNSVLVEVLRHNISTEFGISL